MIRYFPADVDIQNVLDAREEVANMAGHQAPLDVLWRKSIALESGPCRLGHVSSPQPLAGASSDCSLPLTWKSESFAKNYRWDLEPPSDNLKLIMESGFPFMACLRPNYTCHPIHSVIMLCSPHDILQYVSLHPFELGFEDSETTRNTAFLMLVASQKLNEASVAQILQSMSFEEAHRLVRKKNIEELTALHFAVLQLNPDLVRLLLYRYGADPDVGAIDMRERGEKFGLTPLHLSFMRNCPLAEQCFRLVFENADPSVQMLTPYFREDRGGGFRFECDCGGCWSDELEHFTDILPGWQIGRTQSETKGNALNTALRMKAKASTVGMLLNWNKKPFDVDLAGTFGWTPLSVAVFNVDAEIARRLIERGADVNRSCARRGQMSNMTILHVLFFRMQNPIQYHTCSDCLNPVYGEASEFRIYEVAKALFDVPSLDLFQRDSLKNPILAVLLGMGSAKGLVKLILKLILQTGRALLYRKLALRPLVEQLIGLHEDNLLYLDANMMAILFKGGAISRQQCTLLIEFINDILSGRRWNIVTSEGRQYGARLCKTLCELMKSPLELQDLCMHIISDLLGIDSRRVRRQKIGQLGLPPLDHLKCAGYVISDDLGCSRLTD